MTDEVRGTGVRANVVVMPFRDRPVVVDTAGAVALFVLALLPLGVGGVELGELHSTPPVVVSVLLAAAQTIPLVLRRRAPAVILAVVGAGFSAAQIGGVTTGIAGLGLFVAIYSFTTWQQRRRVAGTVVAVLAYVLLAVALHAAGSPERPIDWVTFFLVLTIPWFIGQLVRRRLQEQAARERLVAQEAVLAARADLARDLHDIVTHHVTAIVVQAESAVYLAPDDAAEGAATFATIGSTGRQALQELRSLLGALEQSPTHATSADIGDVGSRHEPVPGTIAELVDTVRATGLRVGLTAPETMPPMTDAVAVTLYRVAQEALTNARRHAPGAEVHLTVTVADDRIALRVVNPIRSDAGVPPGRGRRGMAHRVALLGGAFAAGPDDGAFSVNASLDLDAEARP